MTPLAIANKSSSLFLNQLESSLLPRDNPLIQKIAIYAFQIFRFIACLLPAVCFSLLYHSLHVIHHYGVKILFRRGQTLLDFAKNPNYAEVLDIRDGIEVVGRLVGFATAEFQDRGPDSHPLTQWGRHYKKALENSQGEKKVPGAENLEGLHRSSVLAPRLLDQPNRLVAILKATGATKFRFSVSWDQVDPDMRLQIGSDEEFDTSNMTDEEITAYFESIEKATSRYQELVKELIKGKIEPMITFHHFTDPCTEEKSFDWEKREGIKSFVAFCLHMGTKLALVGAKKFITFNEIAVSAFQEKIMGEFQPYEKMNFQGAGKMIENKLIAHKMIYQCLKQKCGEKEINDIEIGISHDPIRFRNFHKWHPLWSPVERIICHYLTEICHGAIMRYFKTGKFQWKIPFFANIAFDHKRALPIDFFGLQYYTDPLIKISLFGAESTTRIPDQKLSSYGYRQWARGLASAIDEASKLKVPVDITEVGCDTGMNLSDDDTERKLYFRKILFIVQKALILGYDIRSVHFWTLVDNLEWSRGYRVKFGFARYDREHNLIIPRSSLLMLQKMIRTGVTISHKEDLFKACIAKKI